jgi:hypothetical protein
MKLKNGSKAIVSSFKITEYLLSSSHPIGKSKAKFFMSFGFSAGKWKELSDSLKELASRAEVQKTRLSPFGTSYTVDGKIRTPSGRYPLVRTVWFVEKNGEIPRFITAHPLNWRET